MAAALLSHHVSDLTLGKRPLFWLPLSASVAHALQTLKQLDEPEISVWDCPPTSHALRTGDEESIDFVNKGGAIQNAGAWNRRRGGGCCHCVGKVRMQQILCYLSTDESLRNLPKALSQPLSVLITKPIPLVHHIDSDASISEALSLIVVGAQNLVVAINSPFTKSFEGRVNSNKLVHKSKSSSHGLSLSTTHNGREYCWLTQEDVMRFLVSFVGLFSPLPMMNIEDLGIIRTDVLMAEAEKDAVSALDMIAKASYQMAAVAVVENDGETGPKLIGDISPSSLQDCDETAALALATLTASDFLLYVQDCRNPPETLVNEVRSRVLEKLTLLKGDVSKTVLKEPPMIPLMATYHNQEVETPESSSDEEPGGDSPTCHHQLSRRWSSMRRVSDATNFRARGRIAPIVCHPWSSLIAVILQALSHRENYVWVTNEEGTLVGIVTFSAIFEVLFAQLSCTD